MNARYTAVILLLVCGIPLQAETIRVQVAGNIEVNVENPPGSAMPLSYIDSVLISLGKEVRFFRGIELEFTVPQGYMKYRGSLAIVLYSHLDPIPRTGVADLSVRQLSFEPIPNKIQTVYQIPLRQGHGLRPSPYVSIPTEIIPPDRFPLLFRIMPVIKGLTEEVENMRFQLQVKPIFSDEGAVKFSLLYPPQMPDRPVTLLVDDRVIENPGEELLLKEGEHHLLILSDDYRNESRRFMVERAKILEMLVELQDPTPLVFFEAPENARIFFDETEIEDFQQPLAAEPGMHQVKFEVADYSIIKQLLVEKGKTYRVALEVDVSVTESE